MTSVEKLNIPAAKIKQLNDRGIYTLEDLLKYFPKDYLNFSVPSEVGIENIGRNISVIGNLVSVKKIGQSGSVIKGTVETQNGMNLDVLWFNSDYIYEKLKYIKGSRVIVCGKLERSEKYWSYTISNPIIFSRSIEDSLRIIPVYKKIPGMGYDYLVSLIAEARKKVNCKDYLNEETKHFFRLCNYEDLFNKIHSPKSQKDIDESKRRLIFEDMYYFANKLYRESKAETKTSFIIKKNNIISDATKNLPYKLTDDQNSAIKTIVDTCMTGTRLDALIQGDVGSGKTIVAFLSMLLFAENGYQSVLLAPTQVLATQHYAELSELAEKYGIKTVLLKSKMKVKEKREALKSIADGEAKLIVGTHSVFAEAVEYNNLALAITDEEHKFGVAQRESIAEKCKDGVNTITMSATPIPRSLALTLYGVNKKVITISQMPSGRKPVHTTVEFDENRINKFMVEKIKEGQQCYVVCPLVQKSDKEAFAEVESVEEVSDKLKKWLEKNAPDVSVSVITGKMKPSEIESEITAFAENKTNILVATTIIEVGVNIPNANVIVIKNAERFGLSQLHQLRGRVGRGNNQGYCILQSDKDDNERLAVMEQTNNGFIIAEADLKQRGTGDLLGTVQSGYNKYVDQMLLYPKFFNQVKEFVEKNQKIT